MKRDLIQVAVACVATAALLAGCGGGGKQLRLTKEDLEIHKHVLVATAGPVLAELKVSLAGKALMKGLTKILENDPKGSFAEALKDLGLLPRDTALESAQATLVELGWQKSNYATVLDSPGGKFEKVSLPAGLCQEAAAAGADSVLLFYPRLVIDVGATEALARAEAWGHFFACPEGKLLWRGRDERKLSLMRFVTEAAKAALEKKQKTLADFMASLRRLAEESGRELVKSGLAR